jgi:hypothetical protein
LATTHDFAITSRKVVARGNYGMPPCSQGRESFMTNVRVLATDLAFPEGPVVLPDG